MATVANITGRPFVRLAARGALHGALALCLRLERRWPAFGLAARGRILSAWSRLAAWSRNRRDRAASIPAPAARSAAEAMRLPLSASPVVSVIVPTHGQVEYTLRCLASIAAHAPGAAMEVIVVDDAFPGPEVAELARVRGIRLLRNAHNLGFLRACNAAAHAARGEFLVFLNNDTEVRAGWLDHLLAVFARWPDVGVAGSKLLNPDGTLQEAGGILWNDGSGWNYGRGQKPDAPVFNYVREVDYCSGASIMVRRAVFQDMGGFDERYAPAYCEDSDLSFRMRQRGLKTRYQPRSEVVHHEGVSHGRDPNQGVKARQGINQATLRRVWARELARDHFPNGTQVMRARDRAPYRSPGRAPGAPSGKDRVVVLVVDHYVPEPDRDAGSRTMLAFLRALLAAGHVVKFWPFNLYPSPGYTQTLQDWGIEVFHGPDHPAFPAWLKENGDGLDLVLLSRPDVADMMLPLVRAGTRARVAYYGHDLHFRRMRAQAELTGDTLQVRAAEAMRLREVSIWKRSDVVLYPSAEEAAAVRGLLPAARVHAVVPYALGPRPDETPRTPPAEKTILFVAGFGHPPNAEAALWFARHVLPRVLAHVPWARLSIVGSNPPPAIAALAGPHVGVCANVSDAELETAYALARVAVVPLLAGAGVKRKTVEALWHGVPLVTSTVGAQGLPGLEELASVTDDPESFAGAVIRLLEDDLLWRLRGLAQQAYARERFSDAALSASLLAALDLPALDLPALDLAPQDRTGPGATEPGAAARERGVAASCTPAEAMA